MTCGNDDSNRALDTRQLSVSERTATLPLMNGGKFTSLDTHFEQHSPAGNHSWWLTLEQTELTAVDNYRGSPTTVLFGSSLTLAWNIRCDDCAAENGQTLAP
jgi:hypothetical protein